jgi:hypothetical protein
MQRSQLLQFREELPCRAASPRNSAAAVTTSAWLARWHQPAGSTSEALLFPAMRRLPRREVHASTTMQFEVT